MTARDEPVLGTFRPGRGRAARQNLIRCRVVLDPVDHCLKVSVAWHPPVFDPDDLRLRPCWITGGEFRHGDYERASHAFGR
jgi:hypothetical protein